MKDLVTTMFMCPANERWCYIVMSSLIGWAHILNDPCETISNSSQNIIKQFVSVAFVFHSFPWSAIFVEANSAYNS